MISTEEYQIPYSQLLAGFPAFYLGVAKQLKSTGNFQIFGLAKAGFTSKTGQYEIQSRTGETTSARVSLSWLPMSVGTKVQYLIPGFPFVKPSLTVATGVQWLRQSSSLPGITTNVWLPFYTISPALSFLEGTSEIDWFGGFSFGLSYQDSLGFAQKVRTWSFDLSLTLHI